MVLIRTNIAFPYFLSSVHSPTRMGNKLQVLHPAANMPDGSFSLIFFPQGFFRKALLSATYRYAGMRRVWKDQNILSAQL